MWCCRELCHNHVNGIYHGKLIHFWYHGNAFLKGNSFNGHVFIKCSLFNSWYGPLYFRGPLWWSFLSQPHLGIIEVRRTIEVCSCGQDELFQGHAGIRVCMKFYNSWRHAVMHKIKEICLGSPPSPQGHSKLLKRESQAVAEADPVGDIESIINYSKIPCGCFQNNYILQTVLHKI